MNENKAHHAKEVKNMASKEKPTEAPKVFTPKELGDELNVDPKRIRAFLRGTEEFGHLTNHAKNTSWQLSAAQAELVRERFTPASDEDDEA